MESKLKYLLRRWTLRAVKNCSGCRVAKVTKGVPCACTSGQQAKHSIANKLCVMDTGVSCTIHHSLGKRLLFSKGKSMSTGNIYIRNEYNFLLILLFISCRSVERRQVPQRRTDAMVQRAVGVVTEKKPFCGHKSAPLLSAWPEYSWARMNVCEIMHGKH